MFTKALKLVTPDNCGATTSSSSRNDRDKNSEDEEVFLDAQEAQLHPDAHPEGGLGCSDLQLLERQRGAILDVIKMLGRNLITGNFDLLKISLPVKLFEPRSYLEKLADPWIYSRFLEAAAECSNNPSLRMQYTITYIIAGFHRIFAKWAKPYNPVLGETWQASLPDETAIFLEQISHHPPISAFQMFGKDNKFYFHGLSQPEVGYKANAIKASAKGYRRIEFSDGGVIDMTFPAYYIKGIVYAGAPRSELGGTAEFEDKQNGLKAVIHFQKVDSSLPGGIISGGVLDRYHALLSRTDAVSGTIYRTKLHHHEDEDGDLSTHSGSTICGIPKGSSSVRTHSQHGGQKSSSSSIFRSKSSIMGGTGGAGAGSSSSTTLGGGSRFGMLGKSFTFRRATSSAGLQSDDPTGTLTGEVRIPIAHCTGNWLAFLDWDGERFWTLNEEEGSAWIPDPHPLPSDTRFREDLALLLVEDVPAAQLAKEKLENRQRRDAKLRNIG
ncbi:putative Oxysterol-binding protein 9 [Nannochloris sp. 'desiccata']|nr:hypothetical protein KSW81_008161 [Chlorella desiccata (nom. nud.)]KAH7619423.1 putative Oxysterol-binding protein 9 [Chlorella desiccata (nom. nud.)]